MHPQNDAGITGKDQPKYNNISDIGSHLGAIYLKRSRGNAFLFATYLGELLRAPPPEAPLVRIRRHRRRVDVLSSLINMFLICLVFNLSYTLYSNKSIDYKMSQIDLAKLEMVVHKFIEYPVTKIILYNKINI